jgi:hypothetical protein
MPDATRIIFIIRHGEKPDTTTSPYGVDIDGNQDCDSLLPVGWQRAGALAGLFAQDRGGFTVPTGLMAPNYGDPSKHRTYQTILPLSLLLGLDIDTSYSEGDEQKLGQDLAQTPSGVTLVCWEHTRIPDIAGSITPAGASPIPAAWPDDRFDVAWRFAFDSVAQTYGFSQIPQQVLSGDSATIIS